MGHFYNVSTGQEAIPVPSLRSPSVHTTLLRRSMTRRANRAALRPAHQSPHPIVLPLRDDLCTELYADTPMIADPMSTADRHQ